MEPGKILIGYDLEFATKGIKRAILWNINETPHVLIAGSTGGGKSILALQILYQIMQTNAVVYLCDFKAGGDWENIVPRYAEYTDCDMLLDEFYKDFTDSIKHKRKANKYLIFDEFSSYSLSKDSKEFKELMAKISHIGFMGRSFGYHLILISQQFNSKVLDTAIRDQFGIRVFMGHTISTESQGMLFPGTQLDKSKKLPAHCGYITTPNIELAKIQIPEISDIQKFKRLLSIKGGMSMR